MNKVLLVGRIATDPIAKTLDSNSQVVNFTIACNDYAKNNPHGAVFIPCVAWNQQANFISSYLKKGALISAEGRISRRTYLSKQTNKNVYVFEVVIESINSLGRNNENTTNEKLSISDVFPESIPNNNEPSNQKISSPKFENNEDIEWFDELEKDK